ncbi:MAG: efflux transporter outer membrane subunit [Planctomycetota bacterium]
MKHTNPTLALLLAPCLTLAGCTVGPDFKEPQAQTPESWAGLGTSASSAGVTSTPVPGPADIAAWWTQFNDPVLTSLIERAAAGNLTLAQSDTIVRQARAARTVAGSGLYPSVDASVNASRSRSGGRTGNLFRAGFDATWELDIFGGVRRGVEAADAQIDSALFDRDAVMVTIAGEVATTYLDLRGAQRQLAITRQNLEAQQASLDLTQQRFDAGFIGALDVVNAKANLTQTSSQLPGYDAQIHASIYALSVLLGRTPGELLAELSSDAPSDAAVPPSEVPIGLPSELLLRRPDIQRAQADLRAATARIGVAIADQYPRFSLTGSLGTQGNRVASLGTLADRYWSIGPAASLPIFSGGRIEGNIEQARAAADQALLAYRASVLVALQDVETALVNFTREQQRRAALIESVEANRQAVDLSLQLYTAGRSDFLNVLSAQRQLYSTQAALTQSQTVVGTNLVALYKSLGGGWTPDVARASSP